MERKTLKLEILKPKNFILAVLILVSSNLIAQDDSLNIEQCRKLTLKRYPLSNNLKYNLEASSLKIKNIKTIYYPTLALAGQFVRLADVPHLAVENPMINIPVVDKNQYKIQLEATQVIYDGGLTKRRKSLEEVRLKTENLDLQVKLYSLNEQVNEIYFLILLFQEQEELLQLTKQNLEEQLKVVESGVRNGMLMPGDADVLKAEILKLEQKLAKLQSGKTSGVEVLSELMDSSLTENIRFVEPDFGMQLSDSAISRPEYELMELQAQKLEKASYLNSAKRYPYLGLFGQFGYGYPGQNMLEDKANIIYAFGVQLRWTIWDWGKNNREKQVSKVMQEKISVQRDVFDKNLRIAITKQQNEIKKLDKTIESDNAIIALRERITRTKASQLKNGVITSSQYIVELNAEMQAKINKQLHEIQRLQAIERLNTLKGNI